MVAKQSKQTDPWAEFMQQFAINLQRLRMERELTQDQVAYAAGISRSAYQRLERGEVAPGDPANPTLKTLVLVAQVLDVPNDALVPPHAPEMQSGTPVRRRR